MRIHHSSPDQNFTVLPDAALQDVRLSYASRGVLADLLTRPDGWAGNADALSRLAKEHRVRQRDGRTAVRAAFAELEEYGYLVRTRIKDTQGRFVTTLDVYDTPGHRSANSSGQFPRTRHTHLYRHWDDGGRLLYVGITERLSARSRVHTGSSRWSAFATNTTSEPYRSRADAEAAEAVAISTEQPLFNVAGNDSPEARERLREYMSQRDALEVNV